MAKPPARGPRVGRFELQLEPISAFAKIPASKGIVMKDAFHGSARPAHGLVTNPRGSTDTIVHPYRGSTRFSPRRGTAHTASIWIQRAAGGHPFDRVPRIMLEVEASWAAIPCWSGRAKRWARDTVPAAYKLRYDTHVRPVMPHNAVSLKSLVAAAEA